MCKFQEAWIGQCKAEGEPYCDKHKGRVCSSCGAPATHNCDCTIGAFVCGYDLCDDCEHELVENGTTGFQFKHCKKTEQKYTLWYMRDDPFMEKVTPNDLTIDEWQDIKDCIGNIGVEEYDSLYEKVAAIIKNMKAKPATEV